ncbi:MAG: hypothetical protein Q8P61_00905, partial [Candidatus Nanopelagicales bacterium]|nr:hypothetical protein [Candidatus Nanopelagicales bacterium]
MTTATKSRYINTTSGERIRVIDPAGNPLVEVPVLSGPENMTHARISVQPDGKLWGEYGSHGQWIATVID